MDKDKQSCIIPNLETMKEHMVEAKHFDDAAVISEALKYIRGFNGDFDRYTRKNTELIETIKILADQADTKKNNLINFHSANILQGLLIRGSTQDDKDIVDRAIGLAKLVIGRLKDEEGKSN